MRGLLIKDFFCLKKQLINYGFIIVGVIVISILFVLSCRFGNIRAGFEEIVDSGQYTKSDVSRIAGAALFLFMLIPIACTGDITNLITEDEKASFYKVASALPIPLGKRVACRFIAGYLFIAIGVAVDLILTIVLSSLTDIISFGKFCGAIVTFASIMMMYISLFILFVYVLGTGKTVYANIIPLLIGAAIYVLINFDRLKALVLSADGAALSDLYDQITGFMFSKFYILLAAALIISSCAYFAAVYIAGRKREVA